MSDFHIIVFFNDYYTLIVVFLTKQIQNRYRYRRLPDSHFHVRTIFERKSISGESSLKWLIICDNGVIPKWSRTFIEFGESDKSLKRDPVSHTCLAGTVVASWFLTQDVASSSLYCNDKYVLSFRKNSQYFVTNPSYCCQHRTLLGSHSAAKRSNSANPRKSWILLVVSWLLEIQMEMGRKSLYLFLIHQWVCPF